MIYLTSQGKEGRGERERKKWGEGEGKGEEKKEDWGANGNRLNRVLQLTIVLL